MRLILVVPVALAASLSLCGCVAPNRAEGVAGGYGDTQIDQSTFRVTYKGNATMKQSDTDELALLHAAEVAKSHGFTYFVSSGSAPIGTAVSLATSTLSSPASTMTIACFKYRPETSAVVYESDRVIERLGAKYPRE